MNIEKINGASRLPLVLAPCFLHKFVGVNAVQIMCLCTYNYIARQGTSVGSLGKFTLRQIANVDQTPLPFYISPCSHYLKFCNDHRYGDDLSFDLGVVYMYQAYTCISKSPLMT